VALRTYEITFLGEALPAIRAVFEDFEIEPGQGTTTLRGSGMDQAALHGAIDRLQDLGLELVQVTTRESASSGGGV
jgi:hypothetical protein